MEDVRLQMIVLRAMRIPRLDHQPDLKNIQAQNLHLIRAQLTQDADALGEQRLV